MTYVRNGLPPILTIHGDADPTVPYIQSVRLHKALTDARVPNELMTMQGGKHGFDCCTAAQRVNAYQKIRGRPAAKLQLVVQRAFGVGGIVMGIFFVLMTLGALPV